MIETERWMVVGRGGYWDGGAAKERWGMVERDEDKRYREVERQGEGWRG